MDNELQVLILKQVADLVAECYVFSEQGKHVAELLNQKLTMKALAEKFDPAEFAHALTEYLYAITQDSHLWIKYDPQEAAQSVDQAALRQHHFERAQRSNFGFMQVARLVGNIGLLEIREFPPLAVAGSIAAGAMAVVAHLQALIFDIRQHQGGTPEMIQFLISYLVNVDPQPLSSIYWRAEEKTETWQTLSEIVGQRMPDVPVYVLVSNITHSAAEAFAYDLQALRRATIIGEHSRGGAHLVDFHALENLFILSLPIGRAINPITGNNWHGTGVIPDVVVPAEKALQVAHQQALNHLLERASTDSERQFLQAEMETLKAYHTGDN
jgi:retinol-binding protein 3